MKRVLMLAVIFVFSLVTAAAAGEDASGAAKGLTYQQALDMALSKSIDIKNAEANIDRSYEVKEDKVTGFTVVPLEAGNPKADAAYLGFAAADMDWQKNVKAYEIAKDTVAYSVKQSYNAVLQALEKKKLADLSVENEYWKNRLAELKFQNGMLSGIERLQANSNYRGAEDSCKAAEKALSDAYQSFNQMIGLSPGAEPVLTNLPEMKKLEEIDLDTYVSRVVSDSYTMWIAQRNIDMANLVLNLYQSSTSSDPYRAKVIDKEKIENSAASTKEKLEKLVRSLYYSIRQLEENYDLLNAKIKVAEQGLKITRLKVEIGIATKSDVVSAEYDLAQLKQQLLDTAAKHDNLKMAFEKPWAYMGGAQ